MSECIVDQEVSITIDRCVHPCTLSWYFLCRCHLLYFFMHPCVCVSYVLVFFCKIRLVWDKDQKYGQAREYSPEKMFASLQSLKYKPPKFPVLGGKHITAAVKAFRDERTKNVCRSTPMCWRTCCVGQKCCHTTTMCPIDRHQISFCMTKFLKGIVEENQ